MAAAIPLTLPGPERRLVLVVGSGRSGTSTVSGAMKQLGVHVPQPEIPSDKHNPRGYFEPAWVIGFHKRELTRAGLVPREARPDSTERVDQSIGADSSEEELRAWLAAQFEAAPELIVKDPRINWFLPLWKRAASTLSVVPGFLMMLRHPAEVIGSKTTRAERKAGQGPSRYQSAHLTANWVALMLAAERDTRGSRRAMVHYSDLLTDWQRTLATAGDQLDLSLRHGLPPEGVRAVDAFIDPGLHRSRGSWDDVDAPDPLKTLADQVWQEVVLTAKAGGDRPESNAALDELQEAYADLYYAAEATAWSSLLAGRAERRRARPARATDR